MISIEKCGKEIDDRFCLSIVKHEDFAKVCESFNVDPDDERLIKYLVDRGWEYLEYFNSYIKGELK